MPILTAAVIICTRNRLESLLACLESITEQTYPLMQLIIVDSSDRPLNSMAEFTDVFTAERFPDTDLIYLHTQPGLTFQRNQGITCAKADVVFFFDDDTVLSPRYIEYLVERFKIHPEYGGGMGAIAGIRAIQRRPSDYLRRFFLLTRSAAEGRMQESGLPAHSHGRSEFMDVEILSGGLTAYRSCVFEEFTFDETVTGYAYMEDVDFSYRVSRRYKLFYDPRAIVEHRHTAIGRDEIVANRKMFLMNHHYFFFKNIYPGHHWYIIHYIWSVIGLFVIALLAKRWQSLLGYCQGVLEIMKGQLRRDHAL